MSYEFFSAQSECQVPFVLFFQGILFFSLGFPQMRALISTLLDSQSEHSVELCIFLSAALFSPAHHLAAHTALGSPDSSDMSPQLRVCCAPAGFILFAHRLESPSRHKLEQF